jgi:hypothetical protein
MCKQPERVRLAGRLRARPAVELREHVPNVHLDGARTEKELLPDLAIRSSDCDQAEDLELAPRQSATFELACGAAPEAAVDRLAERFEVARGLEAERARPELAEGAICLDEPLDAGLALARGGQRQAEAHLHVRTIERRVDVA